MILTDMHSFRVIVISIEVKNNGSYNRFYKRSWISTVVGLRRAAAYNLCDLLLFLFLFLIIHRSRTRNASLFHKNDISLEPSVLKPNSWTYNFVEVSGHNLVHSS